MHGRGSYATFLGYVISPNLQDKGERDVSRAIHFGDDTEDQPMKGRIVVLKHSLDWQLQHAQKLTGQVYCQTTPRSTASKVSELSV